MSLQTVSLLADNSTGSLVRDFFSTVNASLPSFKQSDQVRYDFSLVQPTRDSELPWRYIDLSGASMKIAVGLVGEPFDDGEIHMSYDGTTASAALGHNPTPDQVQDHLNSIPSITAAGGVSVSSDGNSPYRVSFNNVGVRDLIGVDLDRISPTGFSDVIRIQTGDGNTREIQLVSFSKSPAAVSSTSTPLPAGEGSIEVIDAGGNGQNGIIRIDLSNPEPYAGTYQLDNGTSRTTSISYNATQEEIQAALEGLSGVSSGDVVVTGEFPYYNVEFQGSLAGTAIPTYTVIATGLSVAVGLTGELDLSTTGIYSLLGDNRSVDAILEVEITDSNGRRFTPIHSAVTIVNDLISNPSAPSASPSIRADFVGYIPQDNTEERKSQARANIGAASQEEVNTLITSDLMGQVKARSLTSDPVDLRVEEIVPLTADFELGEALNHWGWWPFRNSASNSTSVQQIGHNNAIIRYFDNSGNDNFLSPLHATLRQSYWFDTNVISTGQPSSSIVTGRPYGTPNQGGIGEDGVTIYGVFDSDFAEADTFPRVLACFADATGVILSLEQSGSVIRIRHRDAAGNEQTNDTSYIVSTPQAFAILMTFNKTSGLAQVWVNNSLVGSFNGLTLTDNAYDNFVFAGNYDGTTISDGFDGQVVELGVLAKPIELVDIRTIFNYLLPVSGLDYSIDIDESLLLHLATADDVIAVDNTQQTYSVDIELPAGRVAVGIRFSSLVLDGAGMIGKTLTVNHPAGNATAILTNQLDNIFNDSSRDIEDGLVFESSGGSGVMTITIPDAVNPAVIEGVIIRRADPISNTVEDQGTGTHCYPLAIQHSNGKTYRIHSEMYSSIRYLSDGEGNSVKVFDGLNRNDHYHNGAALIELGDGQILCVSCGHNGNVLVTRAVSPDLSSMSTVRQVGSGNSYTYLHVVRRPSNGEIYILTRLQGAVPFGAGLLKIEGAEDLDNATLTLERFAETVLRLYPRKLVFLERDGVEYLAPVWATRDGADWEGLASAYLNLETGQWRSPEGSLAPHSEAPYFREESFSSAINIEPNTGQCRIYSNDGTYNQVYVLNDVLPSLRSDGLSLATVFSSHDRDADTYGESRVFTLSFNPPDGISINRFRGLDSNTYRVDCQFLPLATNYGIVITSLRGVRAEQTDASGDVTSLYYDWYGEDFRAHMYVYENNELIVSDARDIVTLGKNGLTHGWLSRLPNTKRFDIQLADNELHHTHRQTSRTTLEF